MSDSVLREKTKLFAKMIIYLCRDLKSQGIETVLTNQLLRSGTSIGANVYEAQFAQSSKDFISKLEIALKESNESEYWLDLVSETSEIQPELLQQIKDSCVEIRKMLISSVKTLKQQNNI